MEVMANLAELICILIQISVITSLASYSNPLTRIGGVEYVAEVRFGSQCCSVVPTKDSS